MDHLTTVIAATMVLVCVSSATAAPVGDVLTDDFSQGISSQWRVINANTADAPWTVAAPDVGGGLTMSKPADSPSSSYLDGAGVVARFSLDGDFSTAIHVSPVVFPLSGANGWNQVLFGVAVGDSFFEVARVTDSNRNAIVFSNLSCSGPGPVSDVLGDATLSLTRSGDTVSGWIDFGGGPILIGSATSERLSGPAQPAVYLNQQSAGAPGERPCTAMQISFDNFVATAEVIVPEPVTVLLLAMGGLAMVRRRTQQDTKNGAHR